MPLDIEDDLDDDRHKPLRSFGFPDSFGEASCRLSEKRLTAAEYREIVDVLSNQFNAAFVVRSDLEPETFIRAATSSLVWKSGHREKAADRLRLMELIMHATDKWLTRCSSTSWDQARIIRRSVSGTLADLGMNAKPDSTLERNVITRWERLIRSVAHKDAQEALSFAYAALVTIDCAHENHTKMPQLYKPVRHECQLHAIATQWKYRLLAAIPPDASVLVPLPLAMLEGGQTAALPEDPPRTNVVPFLKSRGANWTPR